MKITFLGTSAATSVPLAFCNCEVCTHARKYKGKDLRKRSSVLINDDLLIDFGPDIMTASFMHGVDVEKIRFCLQTHSHPDHFDPTHFITRDIEYCVKDIPPLEICASQGTLNNIGTLLKRECEACDIFRSEGRERLNLNVQVIEELQTLSLGKYNVTAFRTEHDNVDQSMLYAIKENNNTIFYGTDAVTFSESLWRGFHRLKLKFALVILDHTFGLDVNGMGHLNINQFIEHINRMREENLLTENARIFGTHISHEVNKNHIELNKFANENNYEIAYDGLQIFLNQ